MNVELKSFVTEDQIEQKKRIRQQEWELKRRPDQPLECPEEAEADYRTLYERLKEQKDKKQEEYEESKKLKHCIKVLDNDEVEFLEKVDEYKLKEIKDKLREEKIAIEEFKKRVANLTEAEQNKRLNEFKKSLFAKSSPTNTNQLARTTTRRQAKLLQNAVKRKASEKDGEEEEPNKRKKEEKDDESNTNTKSNNDGDKNEDDEEDDKKDNASSSFEIEEPKPAHQVLGILPGIANYYSDSSDDSENDSDDETKHTEINIFSSNSERNSLDLKKAIKKIAGSSHSHM